jgi:DUF4097 and DUF4098 domain-containing protein YvlB
VSQRSPLQTLQLHKPLLLCLFLVPLCAASDWRYEETHTDAREFVSSGYVHIRLSVGDLHIKRGDSAKIRLEYTVKSRRESQLKQARLDFNIRGNDATVECHAPTGSNTQFDVELEVPANTHLDIHQKVGDLTVDSVEGDKDLNLGVGDIRVSTGRSGYRLVNASTGIGDVASDGYGEARGWLGKTLKYHGEGKFELRAHVGVGDIKLEGQ